MSLNWGNVWKVQCPKCDQWLAPVNRNKVPGHLPKGKPTSSTDCDGSGKRYRKVQDIDGNTYNA